MSKPSGLWQVATWCREDTPEGACDLEGPLFRSRDAAIASVEETLLEIADGDPDALADVQDAMADLRKEGYCVLWDTEYSVYEPHIVD